MRPKGGPRRPAGPLGLNCPGRGDAPHRVPGRPGEGIRSDSLAYLRELLRGGPQGPRGWMSSRPTLCSGREDSGHFLICLGWGGVGWGGERGRCNHQHVLVGPVSQAPGFLKPT